MPIPYRRTIVFLLLLEIVLVILIAGTVAPTMIVARASLQCPHIATIETGPAPAT